MQNIIRLPGLIDPHVHLREPGATQKEDFQTGTKAAIAGGYTLVLDMPNNPVATISPQALQEKIDLAQGRIFSDVGFHFGASSKSIKYFNQVAPAVFALKVYMNPTTGDLLMEDDKTLEAVFSSWPKNKAIMVHAEGDTLEKAILLAKKFGSCLHVCHVSQKRELRLIRQAKAGNLKITAEVSCHHLFLTEDDVSRLKTYGMMRPPLSSYQDQQALWEAVTDGTLDMIASDHAPHTRVEKETSGKVVNGVPGLETTLPLLLTAVIEGRLSMDRLIELTYQNPKKVFNVPDQPDTYVEVGLDESYTITADNLQTKCRWTPFAGMKMTGRVKKVVLRGQAVFDKGTIFGPFGQVIKPCADGRNY